MSKHCLCHHGQRRQNISCFGCSPLFILPTVNLYTLKLLPVLYFQTGGRGVECMKSQVFLAKVRLQPHTVALSVLPSAKNLQSWKSISHVTGWKIVTSNTRGGVICLSQSVVKELGLFLQVKHSGEQWSYFSQWHLCDKGLQGLSFRGTGDTQQILPVVVICNCCWNQCEVFAPPHAPIRRKLIGFGKKIPNSLDKFSSQQVTVFPLSALHQFFQLYQSCIMEMGTMGLP